MEQKTELAVTTTTIVDILQKLIDETMSDKKLSLAERVKLISVLTGNQLRAGALQLGFQRAIARIPQGAESMVPQLNVPLLGTVSSAH